MITTLLSLAVRNVTRNRRRTLATLAALAAGVMSVGTIRGILNGLQAEIANGTVNGTTGAIQIHKKGYLANVLSTPLALHFELTDSMVKKITEIPGVRAMAPRIQFSGSLTLAENGDDSPEALFFAAQAIDPVWEKAVCPKRSELYTEGTIFDDSHVVLGDALAKSFGAKIGSEAIVLAPDVDGSLNGEMAKVGGAMRALFPGEMKVALVPLKIAQKLLRMEGQVTEIAVAVYSLKQSQEIRKKLQETLGPDFEIHTWDEVVPERKTIFTFQNAVSAVVSLVFLLLMLLGVANTMLMSVFERTREVGTMMAVGVTRAKVIALFLFEALVLGVIGAGIGQALCTVIVTLLAAKGIRITPPTATMQIVVTPFQTSGFMAFVAVVSVVGAVVFALYPAYRASRLRPVEALSGR